VRRALLFSLVAVALAAGARPAVASKTKLKLERIDASDFNSDGVVRLYATIVELEGTVDDTRPVGAFSLKMNGKNLGNPQKLSRFQGSGDPLDLVLVIESSALYGAKPPPAAAPGNAPPAPPPPPPKGSKAGKAQKGAKGGKGAKAHAPTSTHRWVAPTSGDDPLDRVKEAVQQLLETMPATWRVLVVDYGGDVTTHGGFRPGAAVSGEVDDLGPEGDAADLKLIQAVDAALIELNKASKTHDVKNEKPARKLVVLISDGLNYNMDRRAFRTLGASAAKALVPIDSIAFSPTDDRGPLINLGEISKLSNGTFRWARTGDDLRNQIETLSDELNKQYVLTYKIDESSLENKTFILSSGELTSNLLRYGQGFVPGAKGSRGLGWWWLLIAAGVLGLAGLVLVIVANRNVEVANFSGPKRVPAQPQPQPQVQSQQPARSGGVERIGGSAQPQAAAPAASGIQRGTLIIVSGQLSGTRVQVNAGTQITVGKGPNTIQITDDPSVSTNHAMIYGTPGGITLADRGSTNGTFVNNQRVTTQMLNDGDLIRFGQTQMKFRAE
jgi:hypothetical protein